MSIFDSDVPNIYNDPIISRKRKGTNIDPYIEVKESMTVEKPYVILSEIPNRYNKVKVSIPNSSTKVYEVEKEDGFLRKNDYRVDYVNGIVYFHESLIGKTLDFEYTGEGVYLYPDSRVYHTADTKFPNLRDKITDIDRSILVERHRIDEQLLKHPQPSEVVDMRIDYNGKKFRVAKDRIDAEQRKIEEAYVDAKGKKFKSLKARIDSLQYTAEEIVDDQKRENEKIWSDIRLIPGRITLEVGKLQEIVNKEVRKLQSQIDMTPSQITLKVQELREWADGRFSSSMSEIKMLSDRMSLKVDVNGVISSINLSKEGIRLKADKIHISGDTRIDNAAIKSAHIAELDASKIRAGTLRSQNNNFSLNLNTGAWKMDNADLTISNGAKIRFTDPRNKIMYKLQDHLTKDDYYVGLGLGVTINSRFPLVYIGTTRNREIVANNSDFTGFIANTDSRMIADKAANSVIGERFHIRDFATNNRYGWNFDLSGRVKTVRPMNAHHDGISYDFGTPTRRFRNIYAYNIRHNGEVRIRDSRSTRTSGWMVQTGYSGDGSAVTLRGLNGGKYNYSIGGKQSYNRISRIFLKNKPNVSSDRRLKENFAEMELGLSFIMDLKPTEFKFKETEADLEKNKHEFGFIAQEVEESINKFGKTTDKYSVLSIDDEGFYAMEHEQLIAPIVKSIQEMYKELKLENEVLRGKIAVLEDKIERGDR